MPAVRQLPGQMLFLAEIIGRHHLSCEHMPVDIISINTLNPTAGQIIRQRHGRTHNFSTELQDKY